MSLAQGFAGELVEPDWPPLTPAELAPLGVSAIRWRSPRPTSAAALVDLSGRPAFVKRHHVRVRPLAALAEEHAFAGHLSAQRVPVPEVLGVHASGRWTYELHAVGPGADTYRDVHSWQPFLSGAHAFSVGAALARLSRAAETFPAPARGPWPLVAGWQSVVLGLPAYLADRPLVARAVSGGLLSQWEALVEPLVARLAPYLPDLPPGWTHGDGHPSNFLWSGEAVSAVLDLGLADRTTPIFDLATAIERSCVSWLSPEPVADLALVAALVSGWTSVRPLSSVEAAALPALLPVVHLDLALSEVGYFHQVVGSAANAELAGSGYLLGHARWFSSPAGRCLLAALAS